MSTQGKAIVDKLLTNVSNMLRPEGMIADLLLPKLKVVQYTGKIGNYTNEHLRIVNTLVGGKGDYPVIDSIVRGSNNYEIEEHATKEILTARDFANVERPFDAEEDSTIAQTTHHELGKERGLAIVMEDTGIITQNTTLSGTDQFSDYSASDPLSVFVAGRAAVRGGCGKKANTAWMDEDTADILRFHPQLLDKLGFKFNRAGGLSDDELKRALSVKRLLISEAVYNSSAKGQADSVAPVWGKHMWFGHIPMAANRRQVSLGYHLSQSGKTRKVKKVNMEEPDGAKKIMVIDNYDQLLTNVDCAYLIKDAIA